MEDDEQEFCPICGSASFENFFGHYYCLECGTQSQSRRDEAEDEEVVGVMSHQIRVKKGQKRKFVDDEECTFGLHQSWQMLYLKFIDQLIQEGYNPSVKVTAKHIWFLYLDFIYESQLMAFNRVDTMETCCFTPTKCNLTVRNIRNVWLGKRKHLSIRTKIALSKKNSVISLIKKEEDIDNFVGEDDLFPDGGTHLLEDMDKMHKFVSKVHSITFTRHAFVTKKCLLVLVYLALLYSGQYVTLKDIAHLALSDRISYYSWYRLLPGSLTRKIRFYHGPRINGRHPLIVKDVGLLLKLIRVNINLEYLPLDVSKMCIVLLRKMFLPETLVNVLKRVFYVHQEDVFATSSNESRGFLMIDLVIMVNILIMIKLLYRLDGCFEKRQSLYCLNTDQLQSTDQSKRIYVWEDWVSLITREQYKEVQLTIKPTKHELPHLDDHSSYLTFCKEKCYKEYSLEAVSGMKQAVEKNYVLEPIYSSYMTKRRMRNKETMEVTKPQGPRPLFTLLGDNVNTVQSEINPRWVPIDLNIPGLGLASAVYCPIPTAQYHVLPLDQLGLPSSQQLLYNYAAKLISVPLSDLLYKLNSAEQFLIQQVQVATDTVNMYKQSSSTVKGEVKENSDEYSDEDCYEDSDEDSDE